MNTVTLTGRRRRMVTDCDTYGDASLEAIATGSKKLTRRMVQDIASSISEELSPEFSKEMLERTSTAAHVTMFADHVAFVKTLQRHRGEFDSLLQHMSESYKALFADVGKKATLDKYMELQLRWRQGLRKACECGCPSHRCKAKLKRSSSAARTDYVDYNHCSS